MKQRYDERLIHGGFGMANERQNIAGTGTVAPNPMLSTSSPAVPAQRPEQSAEPQPKALDKEATLEAFYGRVLNAEPMGS